MNWGTRGSTRRSRRAASSLITVEVALAVMLMIGSGLLLKSFSRLSHVDPGFNPTHLLTMQVQFPATVPFSKVRVRSFYSNLRDKLAALPGVTGATLGYLPVRGPNVNAGGGDPFQIKGRPYGSSGPVGPIRQYDSRSASIISALSRFLFAKGACSNRATRQTRRPS